MVAIIAAGVIVLALLFPAISNPGETVSQSKRDVWQISTAVNAFVTEYGVYPGTNAVVGGDLLAALTGSDSALNPRKLVFLEVNTATKNRSGVTNGVFVDRWGGPYRIAMASGTNEWVVAGTNGQMVTKRVAVWNDPSLGRDGASLSEAQRARRYVYSWK